jgi:hypothetical protein
MAPGQGLGLSSLRYYVLGLLGPAGLGNGQRSGMLRQERSGDTCKYDTGQNRDGQDVCRNFLSVTGIGAAKDNALNLVEDATTGSEMDGLGILGKIMKVGLEQPKGLAACVSDM